MCSDIAEEAESEKKPKQMSIHHIVDLKEKQKLDIHMKSRFCIQNRKRREKDEEDERPYMVFLEEC